MNSHPGLLPECRGSVAERSEDLWVEVWHLSFDGRSRPRQKPRGWSDFLDHGLAGWWYIHAPGSGIFYHAGRTIAAPSKASMLAALLEEWHAKMGNSSSSKANGDGSGGRRLGRGRSNKRERAAEDADVEARRLINRFTMDNPLQFAQTFRKLEAGVPCKNVSWGRWRKPFFAAAPARRRVASRKSSSSCGSRSSGARRGGFFPPNRAGETRPLQLLLPRVSDPIQYPNTPHWSYL